MKISKEKLDKIKSAARAAGARIKGHAPAAKESAVQAGTGALACYALDRARGEYAFARDNPYMVALAIAVAGHVLKRKSSAAGGALVTIAGYEAARRYFAGSTSEAKGIEPAHQLTEQVFEQLPEHDAAGIEVSQEQLAELFR